MEPSDEDLYDRMRRGDRRAFEQIYERRAPGLFRYAWHMTGSRSLAEETTQEAFLGLMQPNSRFNAERGSVQAYLYGTVRNLVRESRREPHSETESDLAVEHNIVGRLIADEAALALHAAIHGLPVAYRDAVVLCDLEERSYQEAAQLIGCPMGTVRSRLHRARAVLASKLKPRLAAVARR